MAAEEDSSRRQFMRKLVLGATLAPLATARLTTSRAADLPLLSPDDPAAKKVKYTEDASTEKGATKGNNCATCALYEGTYNSTQGPCQIFPGKHVKAAGWCSSWAPQI
jgi:High potential iron-sulfur protein